MQLVDSSTQERGQVAPHVPVPSSSRTLKLLLACRHVLTTLPPAACWVCAGSACCSSPVSAWRKAFTQMCMLIKGRSCARLHPCSKPPQDAGMRDEMGTYHRPAQSTPDSVNPFIQEQAGKHMCVHSCAQRLGTRRVRCSCCLRVLAPATYPCGDFVVEFACPSGSMLRCVRITCCTCYRIARNVSPKHLCMQGCAGASRVVSVSSNRHHPDSSHLHIPGPAQMTREPMGLSKTALIQQLHACNSKPEEKRACTHVLTVSPKAAHGVHAASVGCTSRVPVF